jgi:thiosulfate/3-mercaptopyruvate sulfurtransferase
MKFIMPICTYLRPFYSDLRPSYLRIALLKIALVIFLATLTGYSSLANAADSTNMKTLQPQELVGILADKNPKPLLLDVGSHMLFLQAHIPGSEYVGAGSTPEGIQHLRQRVQNLPRKTAIVLYCGCCPWSHCPNVNPAYDALSQMGFTNVKVLYLANNFGADWVDKGYPVAKGE